MQHHHLLKQPPKKKYNPRLIYLAKLRELHYYVMQLNQINLNPAIYLKHHVPEQTNQGLAYQLKRDKYKIRRN